MKGKTLIIAGVLALGLASLIVLFLVSLRARHEGATRMAQVYVARRTIEQGTLLNRDAVAVIQVPAQYLQPTAIGPDKEIFAEDGSSAFVTAAPISRGEHIMMSKLMDLGYKSGLSVVIPSEKRAIAITVNEPIIQYIQTGDYVDLAIVASLYRRGERDARLRVLPLLENIQILAKGRDVFGLIQSSGRDQRAGLDSAIVGDRRGANDNVIAVAVNPTEIALIALAQQQGEILVLLRAMGDFGELKLSPLDIESWLSDSYGATYRFDTSGEDSGAAMQRQLMQMIRTYR